MQLKLAALSHHMPAASLLGRRASPLMGLTVPPLDPQVMHLTLDSMSELVGSCAIGYGAAWCGLINEQSIRSLAMVVFNIFLPSMLFTSVAKTVAHGSCSLSSLLVLPVAAWGQILIGMTVGSIMVALSRTPRTSDAGRGITVLSSFGNSGVLPLIFINSLFRGAAHLEMRQRAASLVGMYLLGWSPFFWTAGFALLRIRAAPVGEASPESGNDYVNGTAGSEGQDLAWLLALRTGLSRAISPPIIACFTGLIVGFTPYLRRLLLPSASGTPPPLPIYRCLSNFAKAYSPAALLVLAGSLAAPVTRRQKQRDDLGGSLNHVLAISITRFLLVPLCSFGVIQAALHLSLLRPDPLRDFVLLLQSCMPSAQNAVLALQVQEEPERAAQIARILLIVYLIATVPVAGTLSLLLQRYSYGIGLSQLTASP